jgi:predicted ABC-type transport system involved in lysophospholipase L1 biosynthesis ATPase subunit
MEKGKGVPPYDFIRLENLSKRRKAGAHTRVELHTVSVAFAAGESVAILGGSAGRWTTLWPSLADLLAGHQPLSTID